MHVHTDCDRRKTVMGDLISSTTCRSELSLQSIDQSDCKALIGRGGNRIMDNGFDISHFNQKA